MNVLRTWARQERNRPYPRIKRTEEAVILDGASASLIFALSPIFIG
ncbi:hypothetical protein LQV63_08490 [Paenibacillus profundus]|uniref:Uncharacterized protein n=1 Tax=Paenibacillus profundus TaxID=1173085 RepID=A0ABS8YDM6_9BACL|nr:hypothetical protein [Paenibacillus profundus]